MPAIGVEIEAFDVFSMIDASGLVCGFELEGGNPVRERLMVSLNRSSARVMKDTHLMGMSPESILKASNQRASEPLPRVPATDPLSIGVWWRTPARALPIEGPQRKTDNLLRGNSIKDVIRARSGLKLSNSHFSAPFQLGFGQGFRATQTPGVPALITLPGTISAGAGVGVGHPQKQCAAPWRPQPRQ